jgi:hypothetical protein
MGGKQLGFSDYELTTARKQTKREKFLSEMEVVVPWRALIDLIEPYYPKASKNGGRLSIRWPRCCASICCSSGTPSAIRLWKNP